MRWLKRVGLAIGALILAAAAVVGLSYLSYTYTTRIDTTKGIDEAGYVRIGGIDQWVQIRGDDRGNPVLLWLNGGPGFSTIPNTFAFRAWEKRFTVVMWDQRGEGKTFALSGTSVKDSMTIDRFTRDGIEVADVLRTRLGKGKIALLGHSWGSILGVHMAHARPDLFSVYVGTGQVVNLEKDAEAAYPLLVERAHALGNQTAEQQLVAAGPPPYPVDGFTKYVWVTWANELDPPMKTPFSFASVWPVLVNVVSGPWGFRPDAQFSGESLWGEMLDDDLAGLGLKFDVPVVFIQGADDRLTVTALAKSFFDRGWTQESPEHALYDSWHARRELTQRWLAPPKVFENPPDHHGIFDTRDGTFSLPLTASAGLDIDDQRSGMAPIVVRSLVHTGRNFAWAK